MSVVTILPNAEETPRARRLAERFYDWELRGRGWQTWNYAVDIEPPFRAVGFEADAAPAPADPQQAVSWEEPWANPGREAQTLRHVPLAISSARRIVAASNPLTGRLLEKLAHPMAFDLVGAGPHLRAQLTLMDEDAALVAGEGVAFSSDALSQAMKSMDAALAFVELGLAREFVIPLTRDAAGAVGIARAIAVLEKLGPGETGAVQVLAKPAREPWAAEMLRAVLGPDGTGLFGGADDLLAPAREKMAAPLMAVVVRVLGAAGTRARAEAIARALADALAAADGEAPDGNMLIALPRRDIAADLQMADFLARAAYRSGMLLNLRELGGLVPVAADDAPPPAPCRRLPEQLTPAQRRRPLHVTGSDRAAVKAVLADLILHDLEERHGVAVIDPTGDLVELLARRMPRHRLADMHYIHPVAVPAGFDLLAAKGAPLPAIDEALRRGVPGWTAETGDILAHALAAAWARPQPPTLAELHSFLANALVREQWLAALPQEQGFWNETYPAIDDTARATLLRRIERLLQDERARAMLCGRAMPLHVPDLLSGRVLFASFAAEELGRRRADAMASLFLARLQGAMAACASEMADNPPFFVYVNDADRVITGALQSVFAEARRAGIGIVTAGGAAPEAAVGGVAVACTGDGKAILSLPGATQTIDALLAPEPVDALQRVADATLVSARRFGLGHPGTLRALDVKARRIGIVPGEAGYYAAMFGRHLRRVPAPKAV